MIRKLFCASALCFCLGAAASVPAPAIEFACSCQLCTTSTSGLACRDPHGGGLAVSSCGEFHIRYCS